MDMISLKSPREIECMRRAGRLTAQARALAGSMVRPGVTTHEIDTAVRKFIESHGAKPSFLGYSGFPGSACISINEEVIHGIPGPRKLKEGDIVSVDVGAFLDGFHGDCAATFACGQVSDEAMHLIHVTEQSFWEGIKLARSGNRVYDISHAVQQYVEADGCSVVRDFVGHGVGAKLHEPPEVPNFGPAGHGPRLQPGMTIAVEPMVCAGDWRVKVLRDGWTTVSADGSLTAHYENTILITDGEPEVLTRVEDLVWDARVRRLSAPWPGMTGEGCSVSWTPTAPTCCSATGSGGSWRTPSGKRRFIPPPPVISSTLSWISSGQAGTYPTETYGGRWPLSELRN